MVSSAEPVSVAGHPLLLLNGELRRYQALEALSQELDVS